MRLHRGGPATERKGEVPEGGEKAGGGVGMNDDQAIQNLVRVTVATARTLPCHEAAQLLRGLIALGGNSEGIDEVRAAYVALNRCDAQLELLTAK